MTVTRKPNTTLQKNLDIALQGIAKKELRVGWVKANYYPDGDMTTAGVAALAEHGSPQKNIPPRPTMRPTVIEKGNSWKRIAFLESKKILNGSISAGDALEALGNVAAGDIRKTITQIMTPPLKKSTILARERTYSGIRKTKGARKKQIEKRSSSPTLAKPLVFTKVFLNSCTHSVENK